MKPGLTAEQIRQLPAVVDLVTAGAALGLGRTKTYQLAKTGRFPCRIIRVGKAYLVPTAALLTLLGLDDDVGTDGGPPGRRDPQQE
jgi:hypothetical protein